MTTGTVNRTNFRIVAQGRLWFRFAQILDVTLREQGACLWVKPRLHAQYGLRQSRKLQAGTFVFTTRLDGGSEEMLQAALQQERRPYEELRPRRAKNGRLALYTSSGRSWGGSLVPRGRGFARSWKSAMCPGFSCTRSLCTRAP